MKIIGEAGRYDFIVKMSKAELEMLTGYYYSDHTFKVAETLKIDSLYNQLQSLVTHDVEIKKISHTLKTAAGMLEKIDPVFYEERKK